MSVLGRRLRRTGHDPAYFGYNVLLHTLDEIVERFRDRVHRVVAEDRRAAGRGAEVPYAVVAHSLGNLVTRIAGPDLPPGLARFVMLAPPNRPPALARALEENPLFRCLTRDAGRRLCDAELFAALPPPGVPTLVIAGTRGPRWRRLPFRGEPNDGILRVAETPLEGAPLVLVHGVHTFLMNRRDVFDAVRQFLDRPDGAPVTGAGGDAPSSSCAPSSSPGRGC